MKQLAIIYLFVLTAIISCGCSDGGDSWDNSSLDVAKEILKEGSDTQVKFKTWQAGK